LHLAKLEQRTDPAAIRVQELNALRAVHALLLDRVRGNQKFQPLLEALDCLLEARDKRELGR
jgi:hypothetical protein